MKFLLRVLIPCLFLLAATAGAQVSQQTQEATVRIICPQAKEVTPGDWRMEPTRYAGADGEAIETYDRRTGTGFVVSNEGHIMTNWHVVVRNQKIPDIPAGMVLVVQKVGERYLIHRAQVKWMNAHRDLALLHCPTLKTMPMPLFFGTPATSSTVYSVGFPGISDTATLDRERLTRRAQKIFDSLWRRYQADKGDELAKMTPAQAKKVQEELISIAVFASKEFNIFLGSLNPVLPAGFTSFDISATVGKQPLWKEFFNPTVSQGVISRVGDNAGFDPEDEKTPVSVIQHSCNIMSGNSGGPLLNVLNEVIGVVGRAEVNSGDPTESANLATQIKEARSSLDQFGVIYLKGTGSVDAQAKKIILAISIALCLAAVAVFVALFKKNRATTTLAPAGLTMKINERLQDFLARQQGGAETFGRGPPPPPSSDRNPGPLVQRWRLTGRLSNGHTISLELLDTLFSRSNNKVVIGRSAEVSHVVVEDSSVSKQHAHLRREGHKFVVVDRNSSNRTAVNGQFNRHPFEEMPFEEGDTLTLGEVKLNFTRA